MKIPHTFTVGLSFGMTSGVITTLGLIAGLAAGTSSRLAVIGGVATIAVADALSDALGIHLSEESENVHTPAEIWEATLSTFVAKGFTAATFLAPLALLPLPQAVAVSVGWGAVLLSGLSVAVARLQRRPAAGIVAEHLLMGLAVVVASHFVGVLVKAWLTAG